MVMWICGKIENTFQGIVETLFPYIIMKYPGFSHLRSPYYYYYYFI